MFVYEPSLLFVGSLWEILSTFITATIGVVMLAAGLIGWFIRETNVVERLLLVAGAILLIKPGIYTDIMGVVLLLVVIIIQKARQKKDRAAQT
jgi:TRAP-type uncharacterized transport system fused permease subunit